MNYKYCIMTVLLLTIGFSVHAESMTMRCGSKLVSVGDRSFEVERKCGDPVARNFIGYTGDESSGGNLPIEEWIYNQTTGTAYNVLRVVGGRVVSIETEFPND